MTTKAGSRADRLPFLSPLPTPLPLLKVARILWRGPEFTAWGIARTVVRYPRSTGVAVTLAVASPVLSAYHVAIASAIGAGTLCSSAESRVRLSTLSALSRGHKRVRRVRRRYAHVMVDAGLCKPGRVGEDKRVPRLRKVAATSVGVLLTVDAGSLSMGLDAFKAKGDTLTSGFRALSLDYSSPRPGTVVLHLVMDDPFRRVIRFTDLPPADKPLHVVAGLSSRGHAVQRPLWLPTLLVGAQGSGKSSEVWTILRALQETGVPFRARVFDPKGGQEFATLEDAAYFYERNPTKWIEFLERAFRALEARQAELRSRGLRENEFTEESPLDIMIIDELLTVMALSGTGAKVRAFGEKIPAADAFMVYLSTARSAGFTVIACTQLAQKATLGPVADLFSNRTILRVPSDDLVRVVGFDPKAYPAHEIAPVPTTAGIGYTQDEMGQVVKYRSAFQTNLERAKIATRMAEATRVQHEQTEWNKRAQADWAKEHGGDDE